MIRTLGILFLLVTTSVCYGQVEIKGKVLSKEDGVGLPSAKVVEKGTKNGTSTDTDGSFTLTVSNPDATLEVFFIGFVPQEHKLKGEDSISVYLKEDCIRDFFDTQSFTFYGTSGVIHTPVGGKINFALPSFSRGTLITGIGYQSDFERNNMLSAEVEYKHFIFNCDFDIDGSWYFRKVSFNDKFESTTNSFEANLNYSNFRFVAGFSRLRFDASDESKVFSAPVVGLGTWINTNPVHILLTGKAALYGEKTEVIGQATFYTKYVEVFVNYYQLKPFSELTIGVGKEIGYWLKSQKQFRQQH